MSLSSPSAGPPISQANPQAPVDPNNPDQRFMMMPTSSSAMGVSERLFSHFDK